MLPVTLISCLYPDHLHLETAHILHNSCSASAAERNKLYSSCFGVTSKGTNTSITVKQASSPEKSPS